MVAFDPTEALSDGDNKPTLECKSPNSASVAGNGTQKYAELRQNQGQDGECLPGFTISGPPISIDDNGPVDSFSPPSHWRIKESGHLAPIMMPRSDLEFSPEESEPVELHISQIHRKVRATVSPALAGTQEITDDTVLELTGLYPDSNFHRTTKIGILVPALNDKSQEPLIKHVYRQESGQAVADSTDFSKLLSSIMWQREPYKLSALSQPEK